MIMTTHEEHVAKLQKLKLIEEKTLEYLAAVRMEKCLTWVRMNTDLGKELKPHHETLGTPSYDQLKEDLKLVELNLV